MVAFRGNLENNIMEEPTRKTVDLFRIFIHYKAGAFASEKALSARREEER